VRMTSRAKEKPPEKNSGGLQESKKL